MIRSAILAAALLLSAAPQAVPREPKEFPQHLGSTHYELYTNGSAEQGKELLDFMELVHDTYMIIMRPEDPKAAGTQKSDILLYKNVEDYIAGGAPPGSGAYYSLETKRLVGWYDAYFMRNFFAHEGMHQFTDLTSKNFRNFGMWFTEGIADCVGNSEVKNHKLYMGRKSGVIARMRLPLIQAAVKAKAHLSLHELFALQQPQFMHPRMVGLAYAQSWSFCHFLIASPDFEDRDSQIPDGRYRKNLAIYYETLRTGGTTHEEAWEKAFPAKTHPLARLQSEWEEYILKMDAGKFFGFAGGGELTDEEADKLGFDKNLTGIRIEKMTDDGVAKKAGVKEGDVLKWFDGRQFPRRRAMDALRSWMQDVAFGRRVKIIVIRDGKELDLYGTWVEPKKAPK